MALWTGLGQAATVAQLVGADVGGLISMIMQAAKTAKKNIEECKQLSLRVSMIAKLLPHLQDPEVMRRPEVRQPLTGLEDTLREAHELVTSCQGRSLMYQIFRAGNQADRFKDVQSRIDSYLLAFPLISYIDITRRLDRSNIDSTRHFDRIYNMLAAEIAQEVVPLPHGVGAEVFAFAELAAVTNNFALNTVIGRGGSATVYRGKLHDGLEVAIKRMTMTELSAEEFRSERAILSPLHHKHIVRLFGWSVQKERLLVYEYMNNGALYDHLHRQTSSSSPVRTSWKMRIEILLGVSRAIEYLHCYAVPPVIHGDIKSSNVLLDASWVPCVSDFGLSVTYDGADEMEVPVCGTLGYIDPEYHRTGRLKPTSDVYSFGVVMLEVLTGKRACRSWEEESEPRTSSAYCSWEESEPPTSSAYRSSEEESESRTNSAYRSWEETEPRTSLAYRSWKEGGKPRMSSAYRSWEEESEFPTSSAYRSWEETEPSASLAYHSSEDDSESRTSSAYRSWEESEPPTSSAYRSWEEESEFPTSSAYRSWEESEPPTSSAYRSSEEESESRTSSAHRNWEEENKLVFFALQSIEAGELGNVLDRRPAVPEPTPRQLEAAERVARTAARCLRLRGEDRPAMSDVVADLETALELVRCDE